jgi:hypothetical protein
LRSIPPDVRAGGALVDQALRIVGVARLGASALVREILDELPEEPDDAQTGRAPGLMLTESMSATSPAARGPAGRPFEGQVAAFYLLSVLRPPPGISSSGICINQAPIRA